MKLLVDESERARINIVNLNKLAAELWRKSRGQGFQVATTVETKRAVDVAVKADGAGEFTARFLRTEWDTIVQPHGIVRLDEYLSVSRTGRGTALNAKQRESVWRVLHRVQEALAGDGRTTWDRICHDVAAHLRSSRGAADRFDHVVADEAQDFGLAELTLIRALVPEGKNDLFLCGDVGQRIYCGKSPWSVAGVNVRGRSTRLRLNYRTTAEIQRFADRFLDSSIEDNDGDFEQRDTRSLLRGPQPEIVGAKTQVAEMRGLADWIVQVLKDGYSPGDIGLFARTESVLAAVVTPAVEEAGLEVASLKDDQDLSNAAVAVGTMHRAKGLEFKAVAVVGCSARILPNPVVLRDLDREELEAARERERNLLYVACSRARERLRLSWDEAPSEFLSDFSRNRVATSP
jgi:superfamily I DNA/RNA helicase